MIRLYLALIILAAPWIVNTSGVADQDRAISDLSEIPEPHTMRWNERKRPLCLTLRKDRLLRSSGKEERRICFEEAVEGDETQTLRSVLTSREWEDIGSGQICTFTADSVHFRWNYETLLENPRRQFTIPYYLSETADTTFNSEKVGKWEDGLFLCTPIGARKCLLYEVLSFSDTEINLVLRRQDGTLWQQRWIPYNPQTSPPRRMVEK